jgi:hypothetical protein
MESTELKYTIAQCSVPCVQEYIYIYIYIEQLESADHKFYSKTKKML